MIQTKSVGSCANLPCTNRAHEGLFKVITIGAKNGAIILLFCGSCAEKMVAAFPPSAEVR